MVNYKHTKRNGKLRSTHRFVLEQFLGRKLLTKEIVHHKNGDKHDNRIENLEIMTRSEHSRLHRLDQGEPGNKLTNEELLVEVRRILNKYGRCTKKIFDKYSKHASKTLQNHFGTLGNAIHLASHNEYHKGFNAKCIAT